MTHRSFFVFISSVFTLLLFSSTAWLSCSKDKCNSTICNNGGNCSNGICSCPSGYEGLTCSTLSRQKFLGNWQQTDTTGTHINLFALSIQAGTGFRDVNIINFDNYFTAPVVASLKGADSLIIPTQDVDGYIVSGVAFFTAGRSIKVHYTTTSVDAGLVKAVSATWNY